MKVLDIEITKIKGYAKNPRKNDDAVNAVANSIREFGWKQPLVIDPNTMEVIAGHTRLKAARVLGLKKVPCVMADDLTPSQIKAYRLADNRVGELAEWDFSLLKNELDDLSALDFTDMGDFGFFTEGNGGAPLGGDNSDEFEDDAKAKNREEEFRAALAVARENGVEDEDYRAFVEKFELKLTSDDCFTPPPVYEAVKAWGLKEFGWEGREVVRPFYPGGDYEKYEYPEDCVVIDNPPFSILSDIIRFYNGRKIDYLLFAPHLTNMSNRVATSHICTGAPVIYENGARVSTSFVCSRGALLRAVPELFTAVDNAAREFAASLAKTFPKYKYPDEVVTASVLHELSKYGKENFEINNAQRVQSLESMKEQGKGLYGDGFLVSSATAAKIRRLREDCEAERMRREAERMRREAERMTTYLLSDRELEIVRRLGEVEQAESGENGALS